VPDGSLQPYADYRYCCGCKSDRVPADIPECDLARCDPGCRWSWWPDGFYYRNIKWASFSDRSRKYYYNVNACEWFHAGKYDNADLHASSQLHLRRFDYQCYDDDHDHHQQQRGHDN
jgi:hypothetical protein